MSGDLMPLLLIFAPEGVDVDMGAIKDAKAALGLEYRVMPTEALPGLDGRVLAFGGAPTWICPYFMLAPGTAGQELERALAWVLEEVGDDDRGTTILDVLNLELGPGVTDLGEVTL